MMLVQSVTLVVMAHSYIFAPVAFSLFVVILWRRPRIVLNRGLYALAITVLLIPFLIEWYILPADTHFYAVTLDFALVFPLSKYLMSLQILLTLITRQPTPTEPAAPWPPGVLPLFGVLVLVLIGNFPYPQAAKPGQLYHVLAIAFVVASALYMQAMRGPGPPSRQMGRWYWGLTAAASAAVAVAALATGQSVYSNRHELDQLFYQASGAGRNRTGFDESGRIGMVTRMRSIHDDAVALRVEAEDIPGYFRGRVYEHFEFWQWAVRSLPRLMPAVLEPPLPIHGVLQGEGTFALRDVAPDAPYREMTVWPVGESGELIFAPLGTAVLAAQGVQLHIDQHGVMYARGDQAGQPVRIVESVAPVTGPSPEELTSRLWELPEFWSPGYGRIADRAFEGAQGVPAKIDAVCRYLTENHRYALYGSNDRPDRENPIGAFLLGGGSGHCEHFATSAALLLRSAGVATRYVTGFYITEFNPYGGYYVALNRDAHAWVEAWDDAAGEWIIVEATPPAGIPGNASTPRARHMLDAFAFRLSTLWSALKQADLQAAQRQASAWFTQWGYSRGMVAIGFGLAVLILAGTALYVRKTSRSRQVPAAHRILLEMDRQLLRHGFQRQPTETLHAFAARLATSEDGAAWLQDAAAWYRGYALRRYDPRQPAMDSAALRAAMPAVPR